MSIYNLDKKCEGPDSNRRITSETDLESVAFDLAWLPSHEDNNPVIF